MFLFYVQNQITIISILEPVGMAQNEISDVILVSLHQSSATSLGIASPDPPEDCLDHACPKKYYSGTTGLPTCSDLQ